MQKCFDLAIKGLGKVEPNPMVGSVIVHNNQIIGSGYHMKFGGPHAEVNAINSIPSDKLHLLSRSTIYVSLEPCSHFGKTPPCVDLIIKHKIPRVVISCGDPNPKVNGRSIRKLRENGIDVTTNVLREKGKVIIILFVKQFQE